MRRWASRGLDVIEFFGLMVVGIATTVAMVEEVELMLAAQRVQLTDLLLMFLYLEVLAMIGQYLKSGQLPVRFPLYIAMVALARFLILDIKEMDEMRMLAVVAAILILAVAVLVIRYGHVRFPYREDESEGGAEKPFAKE